MSRNKSENLAVPADLQSALAADPDAELAWKGLTSIGRRDFTSWINEAKQAETRERRIKLACENLVKGKKRPCCYAVVPMDLYRALGDQPEAKKNWSELNAEEKRDYSDWIADSNTKEERKQRVEEAIGAIASGKRLGE